MYRIRNRFFRAAALAAALCLLSGCGEKNPPAAEYMLGEISLWEEGPMRELEIPEPKDGGNQEFSREQRELLYQDGIVRLATRETQGKREAVYLFFDPAAKAWTEIPLAQAGSTKEGEAYERLGGVFPALDGGLCCFLYEEPDGVSVARLSSKEVREKKEVSQTAEVSGDRRADAVMSRDGKLYGWQNEGRSVFEAAAEASCAEIFVLDEEGRMEKSRVDGWILGAIQKQEGAPVLFYGMGIDAKPAIWRENGAAVEMRFPRGMSASDYRAVYAGDGALFFLDRYGIWEMAGEEPQERFLFTENGYHMDNVCGFLAGAGNTLEILTEMDGKEVLLTYDLSKREEKRKRQEIVLALAMRNVALERAAADFNRHSDKYFVRITAPDGLQDAESFRTRIQMQLSAGEGPDLLDENLGFDTETLIDKAFLKCLDGEGFERLDCMDSAMETGKWGGKLYGIPYEFTLDFAAYHRGTAGKAGTLDLRELMEKVTSSKAVILEKNCGAMNIVLKYALWDDSDDTYIDWKKKKSHLDREAFADLLVFARKYQDTDQRGEGLEKDRIFAAAPFRGEFTFWTFQDLEEDIGAYEIVGYPRKKGNGIYMKTSKFYVNGSSGAEQGAVSFLKYLLSRQAQSLYVTYDIYDDAVRYRDLDGFFVNRDAKFSVNREVLELMIRREDGNNPDNQFVTDSGKILYFKTPLTQEQIGIFRDLADRALPAPQIGAALENIFREELEPFFDGEVSAGDAVKKLHNRVQLYFDEAGSR